MKKILLISASALLGLSACQNESLIQEQGTTVSFTASLDNRNTRTAINETGTGTAANRCVLQVYEVGESGGNPTYVKYGSQQYTTVTDKKATFSNIRLITGKTYKFVFWADKADDSGNNNQASKYYNTDNLADISIKTSATASDLLNNDERDAFFGTSTLSDVTDKTYTENVTLSRPFAQLNLVAKDLTDVGNNTADEGDKPKKIKITYTSQLYTKFDALNGEAKEVGTPEESNQIVDLFNLNDANNNTYVLMDYLFANTRPATGEGQLINFTTQFYKEDGTTTVGNEKTISNIPIYRNWRTNVSSNFMTTTANYDVTISPDFIGLLEEDMTTYTSDANLKNGGNVTVNTNVDKIDLSSINTDLNKDLNLFISSEVKDIIIGTTTEQTNAKSITINVANGVKYPAFTIASGAKYLQNVTITGDKNSTQALEGFNSGTLTNIENLTFNNVKLENKGIILGDGVQSIKNLEIKNCVANELNTSFVKVAAKNYADDVVIENNDINFADGAEKLGDRIDGVNIWYMNGGTLTIRNNTQRGGKCFISSIPANWKTKGTPDKIIIENNKVLDNYDGAITIQYPNKNIEIKNNYIKSSASHIVFMFFKKELQPNITITGNTFEPNNDSQRYVLMPFGYNDTELGGNDEGASATIILKDNSKAGSKAANWAGWLFENGTGNETTKTNPVSLLDGSDISSPWK